MEMTALTQEGESFSRRRFLLGGGMLLTAAAATAREPDKVVNLLGKRKLEDIIPARIGDWTFYSKSGLVVPPDDQLSRQLYSQLLTRAYTAPDRPPVMLLVAQGAGQTGVIQIHRPETCYPAAGYVLGEKERRLIETPRGGFSASAFTAASDSRVEQLMYWTRVGYDLPFTWLEQRWAVARANLRGEIPDAALVRVSTVSPDRDGAMATLERFSRQLLASVNPETRSFLIGRS